MTILLARLPRLIFLLLQNSVIASADFLDYLPQMNECGLILPKIHLEALAIGALDDGFDRRIDDPACMQIDLNPVANGVARVLLGMRCFLLGRHCAGAYHVPSWSSRTK